MKFTMWSLVVLFWSCTYQQPQTKLENDFGKYMKEAVSQLGFNGNVLVAQNGKIIYKGNFGYSNFLTKDGLNDSSVFELASVSKQFTAMGILLLKSRGLLELDDKVIKYIPELNLPDITIKHLLNHTSGLGDWLELINRYWDKSKICHNNDLIQLMAKYPPLPKFKPGDDWLYSNLGYALLATIITRTSGESYSQFLQNNIFNRLEMTHTRTYNTRRSGDIISNYAFGFVFSKVKQRYFLPDSLKEFNYVYYTDGIEGSGSVTSTILDLLKWNEALQSNKLISVELLNEAFSGTRLNDGRYVGYGFGWSLANDSIRGKNVTHGGWLPGYRPWMRSFIDKKSCIIVLSNVHDDAMYKVGFDLSAILFGEEYESPTRYTFKKLPINDLRHFMGTYLNPFGQDTLEIYYENNSIMTNYIFPIELKSESASKLYSEFLPVSYIYDSLSQHYFIIEGSKRKLRKIK